MKRSFSFVEFRSSGLVAAGTGLVAATYGLVRLAYGLFLPDVRADLALTTAEAGLISSGASVIYCLAATIGFFVAPRHPRSLVLAAALSASVGAAGMSASHHAEVFAAFAVLSSAGGGLASPALVDLVRRNVEDTSNDRSQARVNAGTGPGLVAAGILALVLLPDWRLAWFGVAALTVVVAALVLLLDRGGSDDAGGTARASDVVPSRSWFVAHRRIIPAAFAMGAASAATWNYGRTLLIDAGAQMEASVIAWIALGVGGSAVIVTAPSMSALRPRTVWTVTTLTLAVGSATLALAAHSTLVAVVACGAFGWGYTAATGSLIAWTTHIDESRAATGTALLFVTLVLGQAVGAAALGALVTSAGFTTAFLAAAAVTVAAAMTPSLRLLRQSLRTMSRTRSLLRPSVRRRPMGLPAQGEDHGKVPVAQALPGRSGSREQHPDGSVDTSGGRGAHPVHERLRRSVGDRR